MVSSVWSRITGRTRRPSPEDVIAVQQRERAEAARQRLERAIAYRRGEINNLLDGIVPERKSDE